MAIKRYVANADNSITNAFKSDLSTRGTGSNMGAADSLEVFSLRGQTSSSSGQSSELSRMLIKFPVNTISADRTAATIPASGSVKFYLKMYNAEHPFTLARNFQLNVYPVSASTWQEGFGLDMEEYKDITYDGSGSNWDRASSEAAWVTGSGGDYVTSFFLTASFTNGWEDMDIEITPLVERWMQTSGTALHFANSGALIKLTDVQESASFSYYTKKFFARSTEFFFKRPVIEARWDSRTKDQRGSIYYSSSLAPAADNLNTIYLYNYIRGKLTNIPNSSSVATTGSIYVSLYSGSSSPTGSKLLLPAGGGVVATNDVNITGGYVSTGIYSASFAVTGATSLVSSSAPLTRIFDVWHNGTGILSLGGKTEYYTGSISPKSLSAYNNAPTFEHVTAITNLKSQYFRNEVARFRLFVREKNWNPNIYTVTTTTPVNETIVSASYKIIRLADELAVVPYGTGSSYETYLSHDVSGNYFDLSMKLLESDYAYGVKLSYYNPSIATWVEQPEIFKFRVEQ
jgi:hypothetical protein